MIYILQLDRLLTYFGQFSSKAVNYNNLMFDMCAFRSTSFNSKIVSLLIDGTAFVI